MFEVRFLEGAVLKKVFEVLSEALEQCNLNCSDDGIQIQALDGSNVLLTSLYLRASGFAKFRCDRNLTMGLTLSSVVKILKSHPNIVKDKDILTIRAQDGGNTVTFLVESMGNRVSEYELKLISIDAEYLMIPDVNYDCVVQMGSAEFDSIIKDLAQIGDSITIACNKKGVQFSTTGDIGTGNIQIREFEHERESDKNVSIGLSEPLTLTFASKYLLMIAKASALSKRVRLSMSPDVPLTIQFRIASKNADYGYIRYYLAPKVVFD